MATKDKSQTGRRLAADIAIIIVLMLCLAITTSALVYSIVTVENEMFRTGSIQINLNDGKPVIQEHEFLFEPGMTVEKNFFVQNQSTWDVYYRLYFEDVEGGLADFLRITVLEGNRVLYEGTAASMTQDTVLAAEDMLRLNERRDLTIRFYFPPESGNAAQNLTLSFNLCAEAVQTKNNPYKLFD